MDGGRLVAATNSLRDPLSHRAHPRYAITDAVAEAEAQPGDEHDEYLARVQPVNRRSPEAAGRRCAGHAGSKSGG